MGGAGKALMVDAVPWFVDWKMEPGRCRVDPLNGAL